MKGRQDDSEKEGPFFPCFVRSLFLAFCLRQGTTFCNNFPIFFSFSLFSVPRVFAHTNLVNTKSSSDCIRRCSLFSGSLRRLCFFFFCFFVLSFRPFGIWYSGFLYCEIVFRVLSLCLSTSLALLLAHTRTPFRSPILFLVPVCLTIDRLPVACAVLHGSSCLEDAFDFFFSSLHLLLVILKFLFLLCYRFLSLCFSQLYWVV